MKFLDRLLLSKKLHIYLAVFLAVSVMFCIIFFMFQFQSYNTLERNQMLQDSASVSSRLLSEGIIFPWGGSERVRPKFALNQLSSI